jgi:invasion protein IalB
MKKNEKKIIALISLIICTLLLSVNAVAVGAAEGETFGDWFVVCDPEHVNKRCSMSQVAALDSTGERIMRIDIQFNPPFSKAEITYILPLGISLYKFPILHLDGKRQTHLQLNFCIADGCYSDSVLTPTMLESLLHMTTGKISFNNRSGEPVSLPVSGKGSRAAFNSTQKR